MRRRRTGWPRCSACICGALHGAGGDAMNALVYEWRSLSASSQHGVKALSDLYEAMWQDVVARRWTRACWPVMRA